MATSQQIKALLQSFVEDDREQFLSIALQLAASEARKGHSSIARELKELVDKARERPRGGELALIARPKGELAELLALSYPQERLSDLVIPDDLLQQITHVLTEQRHAAVIREHGLVPRRKLLLAGPPGTGKTLTAKVLAGELGLPLFLVRMDSVVTKFMGETSAKLRQIFDAIASRRGVYLFDEFDSIGAERGRENDVGEMRRVLNSFLQMVETDTSDSLIVAATNHMNVLDAALFRRFDDVLLFSRPNEDAILELATRRLSVFAPAHLDARMLAEAARGLSHSEISLACFDAVKAAIVQGRRLADEESVLSALRHRSRLSSAQDKK